MQEILVLITYAQMSVIHAYTVIYTEDRGFNFGSAIIFLIYVSREGSVFLEESEPLLLADVRTIEILCTVFVNKYEKWSDLDVIKKSRSTQLSMKFIMLINVY